MWNKNYSVATKTEYEYEIKKSKRAILLNVRNNAGAFPRYKCWEACSTVKKTWIVFFCQV